MTNNVFTCTNKRGGFCTAPVWCESFNGADYASYNFTNYNFKFNFTTNQTYYFRVPLPALMRNGPKTGLPTCELLIYQLRVQNKYSDTVIIGNAVLQQFFAEFSYNGGGVASNNTLTLTATPYSLPETYVGDVEYDDEGDPYFSVPSEQERTAGRAARDATAGNRAPGTRQRWGLRSRGRRPSR